MVTSGGDAVRAALGDARHALRFLRDVDLRGAGSPLIVSTRKGRVVAQELVELLESVTDWLTARSAELGRVAANDTGEPSARVPTFEEVAAEMAAVFVPEFRRFLECRGTTLERWLNDKVIPDGP